MYKKLLLSIVFLAAIAIGAIGISAYEAHVINVTATIENAIAIDTTPIDFGTVFPQEAIEETFDISLSQSFMEQARVNEVNYVIRQKPKCYSESEELYGLVDEDEFGNYFCADGGDYETLPLLCPFLSKHETTEDGLDAAGAIQENDSDGIPAFHGPLTDWVLQDTVDTQVIGQLLNGDDIFDIWELDLRVPCFGGFCAQDWEEFVNSNNPEVDPADYILPIEMEHELFGCDIWIEVSGINGDEPDPLELSCIESGGTVSTSMCCGATGDFPDLCSTGACACAPEFSHDVKICDCGVDSCFNGQVCVPETALEQVTFSDMGSDPQYGYYHDYSNAVASFLYATPASNMTGNISATGLKPYATYQLKFEGKPVCNGGANDLGNEYIGYKGRWTCVSGATCVGDANDRNRTDAEYEALSPYRGDGSECIVGYLVWDYFTADAGGNANETVVADNSYHVLWCDSANTCGDANSNLSLSQPDASNPTINFCSPGDVYGELERFACNGMSLSSGAYDLEMILTEESFHQGPGTWTAVMDTDITFSIN